MFVCEVDQCGKIFHFEQQIQAHNREVHMTEEEKKVSCELCNRVCTGNRNTYMKL